VDEYLNLETLATFSSLYTTDDSDTIWIGIYAHHKYTIELGGRVDRFFIEVLFLDFLPGLRNGATSSIFSLASVSSMFLGE